MEQQIYTAISAVMKKVGAVGKNQKNQQQGFVYRGVDAVMNALQPAMIEFKIFVVPEVIAQHREERTTKTGSSLIYTILTMKYTFYAADGSSVSAVVVGEGMDSGDKSTNKAMSVAFKYACFQVFCIPTEEMKDPDKETPPENAHTIYCEDCNGAVQPRKHSGKIHSVDTIVENSKKKYDGKCLCWDCMVKRNTAPKKADFDEV